MFEKLAKLIKKEPKPGTRAFREMMAKKIDGRHIRYVTERVDNVENVIGRDGALAIKGDEFILHVPGKTLLRTKISELDAWELLSKEGVVLTGPDLERNGEVHTVTAFYVYYR